MKIHQQIRKPRNKFLLANVLESMIGNITGVGGILFTSLFLFLKFEEAQIAMLLSVIGFTQLLQIFSTSIYNRFPNKKRIILIFRFLRSIFLLLIGLVPLILKSQYYFVSIFILILLRQSCLNLIGGAMLEWNDHYVPENIKGRYYGVRNALLNGVNIITTFFIGIILDLFKDDYSIYIYLLVFTMIIYIAEWMVLKDISFNNVIHKKPMRLMETIRVPLKDKKYFHFIVFSIIWMCAINIGRPLLNMYVVKYMNFSYKLIAFTGSVVGFIKIFAGVFLGKMIDKKGVSYVIKLCGIGFSISNFFLILIIPNSKIIYILSMIFNGIFMIGFNVSKLRLNMGLAKGINMNAYLSTNNFFVGIATFISLYLSGWVIKALKGIQVSIYSIHINSYQFLFFASSMLQLIAVYYFIKTLGSKNKNTSCEVNKKVLKGN